MRSDEISESSYTRDNPYLENGKWFWYDETTEPSQPYDTKEEATKALNKYVSWLSGESGLILV